MPQALAGLNIAITRPSGQAKKLTQLIESSAGKVCMFPLIEIVGLDDYQTFDTVIATLPATDWAIFISSNAVEFAMPKVCEKFPTLPTQTRFAAIGPTTAAALVHYGVLDVLTPHTRFDSESLLALPAMQAVQSKRVMIFRGVGGREVLAETLKVRGAHVVFAESYQRVNPQASLQMLASSAESNALQAIVVTSSEALRNLLAMASARDVSWLNNIYICVNHARIAEQAEAAGLKVVLADGPGDEAMLDCILRTFGRR